MSLAALSTASSNAWACPSADSAACTASTSGLCSPLTGLAARSRARLRVWSANASRSFAGVTLVGAEVVAQLGHSLFGRADARRQLDHLLSQSVEPLRCVDHKVAHFFKGIPL